VVTGQEVVVGVLAGTGRTKSTAVKEATEIHGMEMVIDV
jgi:hypothetical protein